MKTIIVNTNFDWDQFTGLLLNSLVKKPEEKWLFLQAFISINLLKY